VIAMPDVLDVIIVNFPLLAGGLALMFGRGGDRPHVRAGTRGDPYARDGRKALDEAGPPGLAADS
jgi:hypothetical protein